MFNILRSMFRYLDFDWGFSVFFSLLFLTMLGLFLEVVLSSPELPAHIYGITMDTMSQSPSHIKKAIATFILTSVLIILPVTLFMMKRFKKIVDKGSCSVLLIPIPFVILAWSCLMVHLYRKVSKIVEWLWSYTVISEPKKVFKNSKQAKTIL